VRGPPAPVAAGGSHHSLRKRREPSIVIPEVKPPALPPLVRRHKDGGDVLLRARLPQLEGAATGPHRHADLLLPRRQGKKTPRRRDGSTDPSGGQSPKTLANRCEDGRLRNGVGVEVVQLHPVVVQERPHETARWHSKPPLMKGDETQHIPRRRGQVSPARRDHPLRLRVAGEGTEQTIGDEGLQIAHRDGGEGPRIARRNDGHPVGHHRTKEVKAEGTRCAVFFSLAILLSCGNQSRRRAAEQRTTAGPSSGYIKARARSVQHFARTRREIQTRRRNARSSNDSHTSNGRPANHPSRRINSAAGQATPLAGEAGIVSPPP
jgi:hypothetical protein